MVYSTTEASRQSGQPIEGYAFVQAAPASLTLNLTSADSDQTLGATTYTSTVLTRTTIARGGLDSAPGEIQITVPRDHALAGWVVSGLPVQPITVTIKRWHRGESDAVTLCYAWQVTHAAFAGPTCVLTVSSLRSQLHRKLPKYHTQAKCPWQLYGTICQASAAAHTYAATVSTVTGTAVTVTGAAVTAATADLAALVAAGLATAGDVSTLFAGGVFVTLAGRRIGIESAAGGVLVLSEADSAIAAAQSVSLIAGCAKSAGVCHVTFANLVHFGGEPTMPNRNPFTGSGLR